MKIIQSFWSKPAFHSNQGYTNSRKFGGWLNFRYFLVSTSFSCLTLRRHHKEIELYTDQGGYDILSKLLKLPYDNISLVLNSLDNEDHKLWILGKIMAIKLQKKPFLHVDNDVYLWREFPVEPSADYLLAQSAVPLSDVYRNSLNEVLLNFPHVPECLKVRPGDNAMITNVGIIGGNDIDFFQEFCEISSELLEKNRDYIPLINNIGGFNQIMEEYLFTALSNLKGRKVNNLIDSSSDKRLYESVLRLGLTPIIYKYIHLVGLYKQNYYACEQLELRFKHEFPQQYETFSETIKEAYPELAKSDFSNARQVRLLAAIRKLYACSLRDIQHMKIKLVDGIELIESHDYVFSSDVIYAIKETNPDSGETIFKRMPFFLNEVSWLATFLKSPITIMEIFEALKGKGIAENDDDLLLRITNAIAQCVMMFGILEFV